MTEFKTNLQSALIMLLRADQYIVQLECEGKGSEELTERAVKIGTALDLIHPDFKEQAISGLGNAPSFLSDEAKLQAVCNAADNIAAALNESFVIMEYK